MRIPTHRSATNIYKSNMTLLANMLVFILVTAVIQVQVPVEPLQVKLPIPVKIPIPVKYQQVPIGITLPPVTQVPTVVLVSKVSIYIYRYQ